LRERPENREIGDGDDARRSAPKDADVSSPGERAGRRRDWILPCPHCGSRLIYPRDVGGSGAAVLFDRRCPDCEFRDWVLLHPMAAAVWSRHQDRVRADLAALADALARGEAIGPFDVSAL
jgi:DNA-directed RNA polymerase subunit RPC12/RpoP